MHLKKVFITETSRPVWTKRIYDYPIPASTEGLIYMFLSFFDALQYMLFTLGMIC